MAAEKDITHLIERLELFEERLGVRLEALSARIQLMDRSAGSYYLNVYGELHPEHGTTLRENIDLVVSAYDPSGRVIGLGHTYFVTGKFFGFEAFNAYCWCHGEFPAKVVLYPQKWRE